MKVRHHLEFESNRAYSVYQRHSNESHRPSRTQLLGKDLLIRAAIAGAILAASGAGVWTAVHFGKPKAAEQPLPPEPPEPPEPRIIGTWMSDVTATIGESKRTRFVTDQDELNLWRHVLVVTYTPEMVTMDRSGAVSTQPYEIVSQDADGVVMRYRLDLRREPEIVRIRFVSKNRYWLDCRDFPSSCFRRIQ